MRRELGSFETAATLTHRHAPFVVVVVLELDRGPSPERLAGALGALQRRHPLLSVRIIERDGRFWFEPDGTPAIPLRVAERTGDEGWIGVVEDELNGPFDAEAGPLLRCTYLESPGGGRGEIVLTFHHAAMDAASGAAVVSELLSLCGPGPDGGGPEPAASDALPPVERRFPAAWKGARGRARLAGFVARQLGDEVACRFRTRGARRPPIPSSVRCRVLPLELPEEPTSVLARAARRRRATVNGALAAAFLLAVERHLYGGSAAALRYMTFADLRPYVEPPVVDGALGGYLAMLRYTARLGPETGFWELARAISRQVADGGRRGDKFGALWMSEWVMRTLLRRHSERMSATAVSYSGVARLDRTFGSIEVRNMRAFVSNFELGPEYSALARILNGRLLLDVVYLEGDMDRPLAESIAADILQTLRGAAETE